MTQPTTPEVEASQPPLEPTISGDAQGVVIIPVLTMTVIVGEPVDGRIPSQVTVQGSVKSSGETMEQAMQAVGRAAFASLEKPLEELIEQAKKSNTFPEQNAEGYATLTAIAAADFASKFEQQFQFGFSDSLADYLKGKVGVEDPTEILIKTIAQL